MKNKIELIEIFSKILGENYLNKDEFSTIFQRELKINSPVLSLTDIYIVIYGRFPYMDEINYYSDSNMDVYQYAFEVISSELFVLNLHKFMRELLDYKVIYYIHVPKTGGTSIINNIEKNSIMPVWSIDYYSHHASIYEKLPTLYEQIKLNKKLFIRGHYCLRDVNHLLQLNMEDEILITYRDPIKIQISNINYIARKMNDAIINAKNITDLIDNYQKYGLGKEWTSYLENISIEKDQWNPEVFARKLLFSENYKQTYSNILSSTINPELLDVDKLFKNKQLTLVNIEGIDSFLKEKFGIQNLTRYNEAETSYLKIHDLSEEELIYLNNDLCNKDFVIFNQFEKLNRD